MTAKHGDTTGTRSSVEDNETTPKRREDMPLVAVGPIDTEYFDDNGLEVG